MREICLQSSLVPFRCLPVEPIQADPAETYLQLLLKTKPGESYVIRSSKPQTFQDRDKIIYELYRVTLEGRPLDRLSMGSLVGKDPPRFWRPEPLEKVIIKPPDPKGNESPVPLDLTFLTADRFLYSLSLLVDSPSLEYRSSFSLVEQAQMASQELLMNKNTPAEYAAQMEQGIACARFYMDVVLPAADELPQFVRPDYSPRPLEDPRQHLADQNLLGLFAFLYAEPEMRRPIEYLLDRSTVIKTDKLFHELYDDFHRETRTTHHLPESAAGNGDVYAMRLASAHERGHRRFKEGMPVSPDAIFMRLTEMNLMETYREKNPSCAKQFMLDKFPEYYSATAAFDWCAEIYGDLEVINFLFYEKPGEDLMEESLEAAEERIEEALKLMEKKWPAPVVSFAVAVLLLMAAEDPHFSMETRRKAVSIVKDVIDGNMVKVAASFLKGEKINLSRKASELLREIIEEEE